jgi:phytoene dehydrogenase-like protein
MPEKKVLVIGGGIAGLCAGIYLRKSGFDVEILEKHKISGGLATAWKRQGYTFENCVHWLVGSRPGGDLHSMWKEVFDIDKLSFFEGAEFQRVEADGRTLVIYKDVDRLERELLEKAPADEAAIRDMTGTIRKFSKMRMPGPEGGLSLIRAAFSIIAMMPAYNRVKKLTMAEYGARFTDPLLRRFFGSGLNEMSAMAILMSLAWMNNKNAGYPIGGSPAFIKPIEENFLALGGRIRFKAAVKTVTVEDGRASGVVLDNGERIAADAVVSAADGQATIFKMLEGKYISPKLRAVYDSYALFPSYVQVSLGVAAAFAGEPGYVGLGLSAPLMIDPATKTDDLSFRIFNFDPTFAPAGKTAVVAFLGTYDNAYWENLRASDPDRYAAEKKRLADAVIGILESRFPAARGKVEVVDVATPATVIRYTGNWKGSMEGWLVTPKSGIRSLPDTLPGLKNFIMAGQWVSPGGGLPSGLMGGRTAAKKLCRELGVRFLSKSASEGAAKE